MVKLEYFIIKEFFIRRFPCLSEGVEGLRPSCGAVVRHRGTFSDQPIVQAASIAPAGGEQHNHHRPRDR